MQIALPAFSACGLSRRCDWASYSVRPANARHLRGTRVCLMWTLIRRARHGQPGSGNSSPAHPAGSRQPALSEDSCYFYLQQTLWAEGNCSKGSQLCSNSWFGIRDSSWEAFLLFQLKNCNWHHYFWFQDILNFCHRTVSHNNTEAFNQDHTEPYKGDFLSIYIF